MPRAKETEIDEAARLKRDLIDLYKTQIKRDGELDSDDDDEKASEELREDELLLSIMGLPSINVAGTLQINNLQIIKLFGHGIKCGNHTDELKIEWTKKDQETTRLQKSGVCSKVPNRTYGQVRENLIREYLTDHLWACAQQELDPEEAPAAEPAAAAAAAKPAAAKPAPSNSGDGMRTPPGRPPRRVRGGGAAEPPPAPVAAPVTAGAAREAAFQAALLDIDDSDSADEHEQGAEMRSPEETHAGGNGPNARAPAVRAGAAAAPPKSPQKRGSPDSSSSSSSSQEQGNEMPRMDKETRRDTERKRNNYAQPKIEVRQISTKGKKIVLFAAVTGGASLVLATWNAAMLNNLPVLQPPGTPITPWEAELAALTAKQQNFTTAQQDLRSDHASLRRKTVVFEAEQATLKAEQATLKAEQAALKAEQQDLGLNQTSLREKQGANEAQLAKIQAQLKQANENNTNLIAQNSALIAKQATLEAKQATLEAAQAALIAKQVELAEKTSCPHSNATKSYPNSTRSRFKPH